MSAEAKVERCQCGAEVVYARSASGKRGAWLNAGPEPGGGCEDVHVDPTTGEITVSHMRIPMASGRSVHVCPKAEAPPTTALPFDEEPPAEGDAKVVLDALVATRRMYGRPVSVFEVRPHMVGYPSGVGITATRRALEHLARSGHCRAVALDGSTAVAWEPVASEVGL